MKLTKSQMLAREDAHQALVLLDAAERIIGPDICDIGGDLEMMPPASFLIAHAVEISLSAFLRFEGHKGGQGNHDLVGRLKGAEKAGLPIPERFRQYVTAIGSAHETGQFRYARTDPSPFVMPRHALPMVRSALKAIALHIAARALS